MVVCGTVACVAGVCGFIAASNGWVWLVPQLATKIPVERHTMFLVDLWMHNASYVSGFLGGLVLIVQVWEDAAMLTVTGPSHTSDCCSVFILLATGRTGLSAETDHDLGELGTVFLAPRIAGHSVTKRLLGTELPCSPVPRKRTSVTPPIY